MRGRNGDRNNVLSGLASRKPYSQIPLPLATALRHELARYLRYDNHRQHSALGYRSPVDYRSCATKVSVYDTEGRSRRRCLW